MAQMNPSTKKKIMDMENRLVVAKGGRRGGEKDGLGVWDQRMQTVNIECINSKIPLYSTIPCDKL